jgi:hypothetical protein
MGRGSQREARSRASRTNPTLAAAASSELSQLGYQAGKAPALGARPLRISEGPGQREAPSEQPHAWLANAGSCGGVPAQNRARISSKLVGCEQSPARIAGTRVERDGTRNQECVMCSEGGTLCNFGWLRAQGSDNGPYVAL